MAVADDRVGDIDIPRGSTVIVYVYGAHHAPRYWESPESFDPERFIQGEREAAHALHLSALRRRPARLYRRNIRDAADPHDSERSAQKYDFELTPGQTIEAAPDGHPATEARNPHDLHPSNRTRPICSRSAIDSRRRINRRRSFTPKTLSTPTSPYLLPHQRYVPGVGVTLNQLNLK